MEAVIDQIPTVSESVYPNSTSTERELARLIHHIVSFIVDDPTSVSVAVDGREVGGVRCTVYTIKTSKPDAGKVIGKQGRIILSLREVIKAAAFTRNIKATLEVVNYLDQ